MGAGRADLPPSPLAGRLVRAFHPAEPPNPARDPAHGRHLLSEALDGRDALGSFVPESRVNRARVSRVDASGLPAAPADDDRVIGRRAVQSQSISLAV